MLDDARYRIGRRMFLALLRLKVELARADAVEACAETGRSREECGEMIDEMGFEVVLHPEDFEAARGYGINLVETVRLIDPAARPCRRRSWAEYIVGLVLGDTSKTTCTQSPV